MKYRNQHNSLNIRFSYSRSDRRNNTTQKRDWIGRLQELNPRNYENK